MKVQIKDLKPNPFRDMENYPINQEKVQSLTNSINQTGFWDNILGRLGKKGYFDGWGEENQYVGKFNRNREAIDIVEGGYPIRWEWIGKIEIAYGHHRLIVLKKLFKPDDYVDIPIRELDDPTMIRIMANENDESWGTNPKIIDETVGVVRKFLLHHGEAIKIKNPKKNIDYFRSPEAFQISEFLNGNWSEIRVYRSLDRLGLIEKGELDKEAIESLPTERSARDFVKAIKQIKNVTPEQQRETAKNIIKNQSFGESAVRSALLDEKYRHKKTEKDQREKNEIHFKNFMVETTKDIKRLNDKFLQLFELQTKYNFTFEIYNNSDEADDFRCEMLILIDYLKKFSAEGGKQNAKNKLLQIGD